MNKNILLFIFTLCSMLCFGQIPQENKNENKEKSNLNLAGRRVAFIPNIDNSCNEEGKVTLEITVNRSGNVISAVNSKDSNAPICLIELAIKYALQTKWKPNETAPEKQFGKITYNFKIS